MLYILDLLVFTMKSNLGEQFDDPLCKQYNYQLSTINCQLYRM